MKLDFVSDINKGYEAAMNYPQADRFVVRVGWWSFAGLIIMTFLGAVVKISQYYPSPFSWRVINIPEATATIILGGLSALLPALLIGKIQNHYVWRILVTFTLTLFSYLFVFVSGASIEMHFIFFCMIALTVIYADWRLGWIMLVLVGLHHGILNYTAPTWVYFYGRNDFSVIAHALPVLVEVIFTTILCHNHRSSIVALKQLQGSLEVKINERTRELQRSKTDIETAKRLVETKLAEVEQLNKVMVDRELKMVALKKEIEDLQAKLS